MKARNEILAMVMAGGKGERLHPLTLERTKPSVPFGGKYRIIDFALSNLINSGIYSNYVLVQYKSQSLIEHIRTTWRTAGVIGRHFITVVPPQMRREGLGHWYRGTADSVYQNINLIYDFKPKIVAIFGGDHIYRMNIKQMVDLHIKRKADVTVSVIPIPSKESRHFGIVDVDKESRITAFREKPIIEGKKEVFASMGNYIFDAQVLVNVLEEVIEQTTAHDFGKDIIPHLVDKGANVLAYDFSLNRLPSLQKYEERAYWRDVGTIESFWNANMDLLGSEPKLHLNNQAWPIYASSTNFPAAYVSESRVDNAVMAAGTRVIGSEVKNCVIGRGVVIDKGCSIEDSVIMDHTIINKNCKLKKVIVDRFNVIGKNTSIGFNPDQDAKHYHLDESGIVVLPRGARKAD